MAINFIDIDRRGVLRKRRAVKEWLKEAIAEEGYTLGDLSIAFCSDSYIEDANRQFLSHNYPTDIITFDNSTDKTAAADLLISVDTVSSNAARFGVSADCEMLRVLIHGVLHITGYDDTSSAKQKKMSKREDYYLQKWDDGYGFRRVQI